MMIIMMMIIDITASGLKESVIKGTIDFSSHEHYFYIKLVYFSLSKFPHSVA